MLAMVSFCRRSSFPICVGPFPSKQLSIIFSLTELGIAFPCTVNGFISIIITKPTAVWPNSVNFPLNELGNFPPKFGAKFTTLVQISRPDWQLRNEIAKFVANFGNLKRTSETVCQKYSETHYKHKICLWQLTWFRDIIPEIKLKSWEKARHHSTWWKGNFQGKTF